jgi:hypothetical protein
VVLLGPVFPYLERVQRKGCHKVLTNIRDASKQNLAEKADASKLKT